MKSINYTLSILVSILTISIETTVAQKDTTKLNQEVDVVKAYLPSISNANKVNLLPVIEDTSRVMPDFKYSISSKPITSGFTAIPVKAADLTGLPPKELGLGYIRLGGGMYQTINGELFINLPESQTATFGVHLKHLSSDGEVKLRAGDKVDAPFSNTIGELFGGVNIGNTVLSANLSYDRNAMKYYGYPDVIRPTIIDYGLEQGYQKGDFVVNLKTNESSQESFRFDGGVRMSFFNAKTNQKETSAGLFGEIGLNINKLAGRINFSYDHLNTENIYLESTGHPGTKAQNWMKVTPSILLRGDLWQLQGGIRLILDNEVDGQSKTNLYPDFEFNLRPAETINIYASLKGDLKNNRYSNIALENYWADPQHNVKNSDYTYILSGGIKGKISNELSFNLGLKYSLAKDLYFYTLNCFDDFSSSTSPAPKIYNNAFDVNYDDGNILQLSTELSYVSGSNLSLFLKGNYYNYKLKTMSFAPQQPNFDVIATSSFKVLKDLSLNVDATLTGDRKALVNYFSILSIYQPPVEFTMDPIINLNLGATFEITQKVKLFGRIDNLLNRQNEQWLGYSSYGLRVLGGVTLSF